MEDSGLIILLVILVVLIIGCIIRTIKHNQRKSKFDVPVDKLLSTDVCSN